MKELTPEDLRVESTWDLTVERGRTNKETFTRSITGLAHFLTKSILLLKYISTTMSIHIVLGVKPTQKFFMEKS